MNIDFSTQTVVIGFLLLAIVAIIVKFSICLVVQFVNYINS